MFSSSSSAGARINYCSRSCQGYAAAAGKGLVKPLSATQAAYLAAMVDGEGSISILDRSSTRKKASRPSVSVSISGTSATLMDWLQSTTGVGTVSAVLPSRREGAVKANKQCFSWNVKSVNAVALLQQLHPFMIEKRDKAGRAIASQPKAFSSIVSSRRPDQECSTPSARAA